MIAAAVKTGTYTLATAPHIFGLILLFTALFSLIGVMRGRAVTPELVIVLAAIFCAAGIFAVAWH